MNDSPWNAALNLLARREYSRAELEQKLIRRFPQQPDAVADTLERLNENGLQNDERYAEAFVRSQIERQRGPVRIRHEARQKGVAQPVEVLLETSETDWAALALEAAGKKLGRQDLGDPKVKARLARFLAYRGFETDIVWSTLDRLRSRTSEV